MPLHFFATPADAIRAGEELTSPIAEDDSKARAAGAAVYRVNCAMCHGPQGHGDGPATKRGVPPPPSLITGKSMQMKDGQLMHVLTYGQGGMAAFGSQLTLDERWRAIAFVRDLQTQAATAAPPAASAAVAPPDPNTASPVGGKP
jgi:mono/diheme cytochrome c family protein